MYSSPEARAELENVIRSTESDLFQHKMGAGDKARMGLASVDPFGFFLPFMGPADVAQEIAELSLRPDQIAYDLKSMNLTGDDKKDIVGFRHPVTFGQVFSLNAERNDQYMKMMEELGASTKVVYASPETLAKMGGGDFDGDTLQLIFGQVAARIKEAGVTSLSLPNRPKPKVKHTQMNRTAKPEDFADLFHRFGITPLILGSVERGQQILAEQDWTNDLLETMYSQAAVG